MFGMDTRKAADVVVSAQTGGTHSPKRANVSLRAQLAQQESPQKSPTPQITWLFLGEGLERAGRLEKGKTDCAICVRTSIFHCHSAGADGFCSRSLTRGPEHGVNNEASNKRYSMVGEERIWPSVHLSSRTWQTSGFTPSKPTFSSMKWAECMETVTPVLG